MDISLCVDPGRPWSDLLELARAAESRGFLAVYVPDHFGAMREAWTLLSALATSTERVRLGPLVLSVTHRPVAVLQGMARTLHEVSHERLLLGLGAGWDEAEHRSLQLDFPPPARRFELLEEAARRFAGSGPPLLIGGGGERRTMPIAARYAAAWHTWAEPEVYERKCRVMDRLCREAGRDPSAVRRVTGDTLIGDADPTARLAAYRRAGADEFVARDDRNVSVRQSLAALPATA